MRGLALSIALLLAGCVTYSPVRHPETHEVVAVCSGMLMPGGGTGVIGAVQAGLSAVMLIGMLADHADCVKDARARGYVVEHDWFDPTGQPSPVSDPMEGHQNFAAPAPEG